MDGRQVQDVESHLRDLWEAAFDVAERPVLAGFPRRAREELVPRGKARSFRLDDDLELLRIGHRKALVRVAIHQLGELIAECGGCGGAALSNRAGVCPESVGIRAVGAAGSGLDHSCGDFQLERDVLARLDPFGELPAPGLEGVHPGLDGVEVPAELPDHELAPPAVVHDGHHRNVVPELRRLVAPAQHARQGVVPVREDVRLHGDPLAKSPLGREPSAVDLGRDRFDHDSSPAVRDAIEAALQRAWTTRHAWRDAGLEVRAAMMRSVAGVLRAGKERYAALLTSEMGKPIVEAEAEVEKCAWTAGWIADNAGRLLADEPIESTASESYVRFQPLGVVLAVMPWNFPFWQAFRAGLPALAAGNVMLLKHSSNVPQSALAIEEVFREAGVPEGVFQTLLIGPGAVEGIIADRRVAGVTLTGSCLLYT